MCTVTITNLEMNDYLEEEEIKIEYNESFETDPLCDKLDTNPIECCDIAVGFIPSHTQNCEILAMNNDSNSSICDLEPDHFESYICIQPQTWYRQIDDSGKFVCKFCDLTYSTVQTIRHHVKTKHPTNATALKNVIKTNKRNPKIKCHVCKKRFRLINDLKEHMKSHYSEESFQSCKVCFATFNDEQEMIQHSHQKHRKTPNTKAHSCRICGYQTPKLSHFKQHKNTHLMNKNLKCDSCDYATNYSPNLKIHQRIHTNDKPYACSYDECGYRCAAKSALRSHQLKHNSEENMLYCDKCTYKTVYTNSLKKHMDSHDRNTLKVI